MKKTGKKKLRSFVVPQFYSQLQPSGIHAKDIPISDAQVKADLCEVVRERIRFMAANGVKITKRNIDEVISTVLRDVVSESQFMDEVRSGIEKIEKTLVVKRDKKDPTVIHITSKT